MPDTTLTPSELTYLIGSKFLTPDQIDDPQLKAASDELKAGKERLAAAVVSAALVALRDQGAVSMQYVEQKKLGLFTSRHVMLAGTGESSYGEETIERRLAAQLREDPRSVHDVVGAWLGRQVPDPWATAMFRAYTALEAAGMIVDEQQDTDRSALEAVMGKKKTISVTRPNPDAVAQALPQASAWAQRWISFRDSEPDLHTHVIEEIGKTLSAKKETEYADD